VKEKYFFHKNWFDQNQDKIILDRLLQNKI